MTAQVNEERAQICVWFASTNLVASLTSNWQQLQCRECPEWVKIPGKWDKGREKRLKCLLLLHSPPLTHLGDRESWKCICSVEFEEKRLWANVWGAKLGFLESLKHTFGWNTTLCKEQVAEKTHKNVPPRPFYFKQIGLTFESEAKFSRYNFIEIHRVLAAREYGNITNGSRYEPRSNANHGTNDLNLPIDSRVFEAAIQGVDLHAIRFAQHLPETQIGFARNTKAICLTQNLP